VSTHTANPSVYTGSKTSVIPNFKLMLPLVIYLVLNLVLFLMLNIVINLQLHLILARVVILVLINAKSNVSLVLATVDLTVNLNCKL